MLVNLSTFNHAVREFETNRAKLYRSDGSPVYGDKELQERLTALLERPRMALGMLEKEVTQTIEESERDQLTADLDPVLSLSDSELSRAAALRGFVEDAVGESDLPTLAKTLAAVLVHGGKAEQVLYLRAGNKRIEAFKDDRRGSGDWTDTDGISDCVEQLGKLRASLTDAKQPAKLDASRQRVREAHEALMNAKAQMRELDGSSATHRAQVGAMYQAAF